MHTHDQTDTTAPFHRAEDGMITVLSVVTVFGLAVLAALVGSVGVAVNRKIEAQNAADAVALSCSVQRARTLNSVTAVNHMTGELLAAIALQEAIGGWEPGGKERDTAAEDARLDKAHAAHEVRAAAAKVLKAFDGAKTPAYKDVRDEKGGVVYDNALLDGHRELKYQLAELYRTKVLALDVIIIGHILIETKFPPIVAIGAVLKLVGIALYKGLTIAEKYMQAEYEVLGFIGSFSETTTTPRNLIYDAVPNLWAHSDRMVQKFPDLLTDTAKGVAKLNRADGGVYPERSALSLEPENPLDDLPAANDRLFVSESGPKDEKEAPAHWKRANVPGFCRSQVVRATYPWVNYHRVSVLKLTKWMVFSDFPKHYRNWTTEVTARRCQEHYRREGTHLYVLSDLDPARKKSGAAWLSDPKEVERTFAVVGFARRPPPERWSDALLPATNKGGTVTFAQSLLYNANPRRPDPDDLALQPLTGWDTLNWDHGEGKDPAVAAAPEWPVFRRFGYPKEYPPKVKLNWQAKLVPVTRLKEALREGGDPFLKGAILTVGGTNKTPLALLDPDSPLIHGH